MQLDVLVQATLDRRVRLTRHSVREATADQLSRQEVFDSVLTGGQIIEDYPDAFPLPACLVLGFNASAEPIHSVWGYDPDPGLWLDWRIRR
ncbi:MAG: DUF4258 domain-containing protein [Gemmatimonadaceae bacterium]|nr:DUF4258 domain-containing protein [Gloeobacterales cyanobacterium ES-bin-141]